MPNPLLNLVEKYAGPNAVPRARRFVMGIAEDFWKDGPENPFTHIHIPGAKTPGAPTSASTSTSTPATGSPKAAKSSAAATATTVVWHAAPGEISEKMWGKGYVQPADAALSDMLITPLGLNKDLSILDLSAGLGERLRKTAEKYGVYITGLEPDAQIAARGMEMSIIEGKGKRAAIAAYDPASFSLTKSYDCIIARETFYRVANRRKFFVELSACAKPKAQLSFTDYIVNPEDREKSAIKKWIAFEPGANPASLVEIAEDWAKAGFNLRVHDDQTALYVKEVAEGVKRLAVFLAKGAKPDAETRAALRRRVETWALRLVALDQGMKFYRFYGLKQ